MIHAVQFFNRSEATVLFVHFRTDCKQLTLTLTLRSTAQHAEVANPMVRRPLEYRTHCC